MIDAHLHLWRLDRADYAWLTPALGPALYRDVLPEHALPYLHAAGVQRALLVQAAATEAETRYLLQLACGQPWVAGVVGWVDLAAVDVRQRIALLQHEGAGLLKGLRPMVQDIADVNWLARAELDAGFDALVAHGLAFDALVRPVHFDALSQRLAHHPGLRAVLDHAGKPDIAQGGLGAWAAGLQALAARHPGLVCKLSGLLTEAAAATTIDALRPCVREVFGCFGPGRVMWGSDWPVLNLRSDYASWHTMARTLVAEFAPGHEANVFGNTARRVYDLRP
jgi:L-fuconolactonase